MILEFSVANFRSFKTLQTLSMMAANIESQPKELDEQNVAKLGDKWKVLKSKLVYGANASGKSNLVKAMSAFVLFVRYSAANEEIMKRLIAFFALAEGMEQEPTFFQLIFTLKDEEGIDRMYRYGFEVKENQVASEWLFGAPRGVEKPFFFREGMEVTVNQNSFKEAKKFEDIARNGDSDIFRPNSLFLTAVSAMGGKFAKTILTYIGKIAILAGLDDPRFKLTLAEKLKDPQEKKHILELLQNADFDIADIWVKESDEADSLDLPEELKILFQQGKWQREAEFVTKRKKYNALGQESGEVIGNFAEWESEGTQKLFALGAVLIDALREGRTLVMDEFDARLHPLLTKKILSLFNSSLTNPNHAQLIAVTHDVSLQKPYLLRRDQICFVAKDKFGASSMSTLVEFKGVRNDAAYDKAYEQGEYGAVPFLNQLDSLFLQDA